MKRPRRTRGGKVLSKQQYDDVLEYLLELDPASRPLRRGESRATGVKEQNAIDQMPVQVATGLRAIGSIS